MPRSSWVYKGKPTKIPPHARTPGEPPADHVAPPPPHTRAAARTQRQRAGIPRAPAWSADDDALIAMHATEGRPLPELCAALPHRSERQVIARTRALMVHRLISRADGSTLIDRREINGKGTGLRADPVKVARHWQRQGATSDVIAAQLRRVCPEPHGWPAQAVEAVLAKTGLALIDVRRLLPDERKLS